MAGEDPSKTADIYLIDFGIAVFIEYWMNMAREKMKGEVKR